MSKMPVQKPGRSKQDYGTPRVFQDAVLRLLGLSNFYYDLACTQHNMIATACSGLYTPLFDSLVDRWPDTPEPYCNWLNPPFSHIAPWARKCAESGVNVALLVPAAVGSNWFRDYVDGKAFVLLLNGRISFDGKAPYPKDCMLCLYNIVPPGYEVWNWRA